MNVYLWQSPVYFQFHKSRTDTKQETKHILHNLQNTWCSKLIVQGYIQQNQLNMKLDSVILTKLLSLQFWYTFIPNNSAFSLHPSQLFFKYALYIIIQNVLIWFCINKNFTIV